MPYVDLERGSSPLILSFPHAGTQIVPQIEARLTPIARTVPDTDWYVDRLYSFAREIDATTIVPHLSRYVVDLNRDPNDTPLYTTKTTTVCPTETFDGEPLYRSAPPDAAEIRDRIARYWLPYHTAISREIARVKALHGYAILLDGHSIWGTLPLLFDGELPDVNIGTNSGRSCAASVTDAVACAMRTDYPSLVIDGRFKGGYITRTYGNPSANVHAIQIELNQRIYLTDGSRTVWSERRAGRLAVALWRSCQSLLALSHALRGTADPGDDGAGAQAATKPIT